jgi:hypothetical protein
MFRWAHVGMKMLQKSSKSSELLYNSSKFTEHDHLRVKAGCTDIRVNIGVIGSVINVGVIGSFIKLCARCIVVDFIAENYQTKKRNRNFHHSAENNASYWRQWNELKK